MAQVVDLAKRLQISTVAEGVETEQNEALIRRLGCDYGQGFYYSRPVSTVEFDEKYMKIKRGSAANESKRKCKNDLRQKSGSTDVDSIL